MRAIQYPFTLTTSGKVVATSDVNKIFLDRVLTLVSTISTQRAMTPGYGVDYKKGLYENAGDFETGFEAAVREAVSRWIPEVTVVSYNVKGADESGVATLDLELMLPTDIVEKLSVKTYTITKEGNLQ